MSYVDGFVVAVPTKNKEQYRQFSENSVSLFKEYGAEKVIECWGDDVPQGEMTSFPMAVKLKEGETVVLSWITWPSKEVRQAAWEKMKDDPRMHWENMELPFDGQRVIYGGFETIVEG